MIVADGRLIPLGDLVGVAQITDLLNQHRDQMTLPEDAPRTIKRSHVSNWANRRDTTGFPEPLPVRAFAGLMWDRRDFVDPHDRLTWTGPPGRWARKSADLAAGTEH